MKTSLAFNSQNTTDETNFCIYHREAFRQTQKFDNINESAKEMNNVIN